ncbi:ABC-F family ATP-binding cassette domain-containing protein [Thiomonas arsenitoxydans]|jgi:ATP-binding cassette subfamily F protein 3|uniref:ABC-F family ATP-binding cassette domain-containing protein n=1 Tax=Thiomonas arsenitoxydans (strain DSM 22701 / CIP 110005 / 3As) TaxID=426114 RepID=UPI001AC742B0|nr:ATP-binding cassette domain-containing protein [Thiomonas arsenitoxydans]MBN8776297.1 ATP-binding cassette domain-containing protein [Thiomonas arsenitoxydans]
MIRLTDIVLRRGIQVVLDHASLTLHPGDKVGLVGVNGAGKTSLFALLLGGLHEDAGKLEKPANWRLATVAQDVPDSGGTATDFVLQGDVALQAAQQALQAAMAAPEHDEASGHALGEAQHAFELADGYTARARAEALLLGLGFSMAELHKPVMQFSGGWRMRLALAQALFAPSDCLLLDEPTNHLDLDALVWLEQWLARYPGLLLVISHDREFLDAVCRVTVHLDGGKLTRYGGNYTLFEEQRAEKLMQQQAAFARQQQDIARLTRFVERFRAKATKARQAQSRMKALERMERLAPVYLSGALRIELLEPLSLPQQLLTLSEADCGYGDPPVLRSVARDITGGLRIGILGANGQGKSTLVKTLAGVLPLRAGHRREGKGLVIGYFAQQEVDVLRLDESPLQHMQHLARDIAPNTTEQEWRNWLGRYQFDGDMMTRACGSFSGGEKARLALALVIWRKPNLLLLDEPTNHLDLPTREALAMALQDFAGTVLLVSHDRALLRATCDAFWLVADGQVRDFDGSLDDYQQWALSRTAQRQSAAQDKPKPPGTAADEPLPAADRKEARRQQAEQRQQRAQQLKPVKAEFTRVEQELRQLEAERTAIEAALAHPDTPAAERVEQGRRHHALAERIGALEERWLELGEQLESLQSV